MTILPRHKDVAKSRLKMSNPWHLLAVGFGSGLSPIVPGTMGSLAAIPFWYLMTFLPWQLYSLVVMLGICIGVYLCHQTAKDMGVHDLAVLSGTNLLVCGLRSWRCRPMTGSGLPPDL